jgi:hypothetical protein
VSVVPNLPISGLPLALALDDADLLAVVQGGVTDRCTVQQIIDAVLAQIGTAVVTGGPIVADPPHHVNSVDITPYVPFVGRIELTIDFTLTAPTMVQVYYWWTLYVVVGTSGNWVSSAFTIIDGGPLVGTSVYQETGTADADKRVMVGGGLTALLPAGPHQIQLSVGYSCTDVLFVLQPFGGGDTNSMLIVPSAVVGGGPILVAVVVAFVDAESGEDLLTESSEYIVTE